VKIALDAMGGDHAPVATVAGAVLAAREIGIAILLVGERDLLERELARHQTGGLDLEVRHASEVIAMDESPTQALRRRDSSMSVGLQATRAGETGGFVFAGNTGAGMVLGAHVLGRTPGVERPAIAVAVPTPTGHTFLLDAGANVDCRPVHLAQFALMGDAYARAVRRIAAPRVGLLSNGTEQGKGNGLVRATAPLLRQLPIHFVGYVEARDISSGAVDVAVCDGFVGNLVLKGLEGFGGLIALRLRAMLQRSLKTKLAAVLLRAELEGLKRDLDPGETGGALLLGLEGVAVKAHGSSDARAIRNALGVASELAASEVVAQVGRGVAATVELAAAAAASQAEAPAARGFFRSLRGRLRRDARGGEADASALRDGQGTTRTGPATDGTDATTAAQPEAPPEAVPGPDAGPKQGDS
jgi:glycerol-3-phosphate acyltransferase PlsX